MRDIIKATIAAPVSRLGIRCLIVLALIILLDQASKAWVIYGLRLPSHGPVTILPFFSFTLVHNTGMSFGLLGGSAFGRWFLTLFQLTADVVGQIRQSQDIVAAKRARRVARQDVHDV